MAKRLTTKNPNDGKDIAAYWIPTQVTMDKLTNTGSFLFVGYVSEAARRAGCQTLAQKVFYVSPSLYTGCFATSQDVWAACYAAAAQTTEHDGQSFFAGAEDC